MKIYSFQWLRNFQKLCYLETHETCSFYYVHIREHIACGTLPTISSFFGRCSYWRRNTIWDLPIIKKSTMTTNMKISFLSLQFQLQYQNCVQEVEIWKHHSLILWPPQFITNKYLNLRMKLSYLAKNCLLRKYSL